MAKLWATVTDMHSATIRTNDDKLYRVHYPNRDHLWETLDELPPRQWSRSFSSKKNGGYGYGESWDLGAGWSGAMKNWTNGWPEGLKQAQPIIRRLKNVLPSVNQRPKHWRHAPYATGPTVDVVALYSGIPTPYMVRRERKQAINKGGRKIVRVLVNLSVSAFVDSKLLVARGATMLAMIDKFESCGMSVELDAGICVSGGYGWGDGGGGKHFVYTIRLKDAGQPWTPDHIAAMIAHPAGFRRLGFRAMEHTIGTGTDSLYSDYGHPAPIKPHLDPKNPKDVYDVVIDSDVATNSEIWQTEHGQTQYILAQMAGQGLEVRTA